MKYLHEEYTDIIQFLDEVPDPGLAMELAASYLEERSEDSFGPEVTQSSSGDFARHVHQSINRRK